MRVIPVYAVYDICTGFTQCIHDLGIIKVYRCMYKYVWFSFAYRLLHTFQERFWWQRCTVKNSLCTIWIQEVFTLNVIPSVRYWLYLNKHINACSLRLCKFFTYRDCTIRCTLYMSLQKVTHPVGKYLLLSGYLYSYV